MGKIHKTIIAMVIAVLFVGTMVGTAVYYKSLLASKNAEIGSLSNESANQKKVITSQQNTIENQSVEIANLTSQLNNNIIQAANLTAYLGVTDVTITGLSPYMSSPYVILKYNALSLTGSVANIGNKTAYNAGLRVVGYSDNGTLEINMTVPLVHGSEDFSYGYFNDADFGTDNATQAFMNKNSIGESPLNFQSLEGLQAAIVSIRIVHEGIVTNWMITPVWTNVP